MLVSRQQRDQIWRNLTTFAKKSCLWQLFDSLFLIGQNIEPTLAKLVHYWANFIVANGKILKNNLTIITPTANEDGAFSSLSFGDQIQ